VVVGQHREGGATATPAPDQRIGADEARAAAEAIGAADTLPLDDTALREIFGDDEEDPDPETK
jgi:hypothetical protein